MVSEGLEALQAQLSGCEDVVAELGVAVVGEVVGEEVEVASDKLRDAPVLDAGDDLADLFAAFDLEAVRAVVAAPLGVQAMSCSVNCSSA